MRLVMLLTIPSAIGLIILAEPIIGLIYQHGRFTGDATMQTAAALRFYAIGLAGYAGVKVLAPAFYALDKRHLPMIVSLISHRGKLRAQLVLHFSSRARPPRARALHQFCRDHQFPPPLCHDAPAHRPARDGHDADDVRQSARGGRGPGGDLSGGAAFLFPPPTHGSRWKLILEVLLTIAVGAGAFFGNGLSAACRGGARRGHACQAASSKL